MKMYVKVFFVLLFFPACYCCAQQNEIKAVADKFLLAIYDDDYEQAKVYSSPEMVEKFDALSKMPLHIAIAYPKEEGQAIKKKRQLKKIA